MVLGLLLQLSKKKLSEAEIDLSQTQAQEVLEKHKLQDAEMLSLT